MTSFWIDLGPEHREHLRRLEFAVMWRNIGWAAAVDAGLLTWDEVYGELLLFGAE